MPFLALRVGADIGLVHLDTTNVAPFVDIAEYRAFAIDADLVLAPDHSRLAGAPLGVMDPMLFAGIGLRNAFDVQGREAALTVASYGGGVSYWLHDIFRIDLEARRWVAVAGPDELAGGFHHHGWSVGFGLAFHVASGYAGEPGEPPVVTEPRVDTVWLEPDTTAGAEEAGPPGASGPALVPTRYGAAPFCGQGSPCGSILSCVLIRDSSYAYVLTSRHFCNVICHNDLQKCWRDSSYAYELTARTR